MQIQLCAKLLSKVPRNRGSITANSNPISPKSVFSSTFLKTDANPFSQHSFFEYSTLSRSHLWKLWSPNGVTGKVRRGDFSSSVLARRFFWNGQSKFPVRIHSRRSFHSFDPRRSVFRRLTSDGVVIRLIMTNIAVFVLWNVTSREFMVKNFMISVDNFTSGRLHTLITNAFSHRDPLHLISNMFGLYFFGTSIGQTFGPGYLLKLYLSGALVGSIFYLVYHAFIAPSFQRKQMLGIDPSKIPGLGASGAVNAIMLLDIFLYPTKTIYFDLIIPIPAILLGIFMIGTDVVRVMQGDHQVSGSAHLGGATVAALAWAQSRRGRFRRF